MNLPTGRKTESSVVSESATSTAWETSPNIYYPEMSATCHKTKSMRICTATMRNAPTSSCRRAADTSVNLTGSLTLMLSSWKPLKPNGLEKSMQTQKFTINHFWKCRSSPWGLDTSRSSEIRTFKRKTFRTHSSPQSAFCLRMTPTKQTHSKFWEVNGLKTPRSFTEISSLLKVTKI